MLTVQVKHQQLDDMGSLPYLGRVASNSVYRKFYAESHLDAVERNVAITVQEVTLDAKYIVETKAHYRLITNPDDSAFAKSRFTWPLLIWR